MMDIETERLIVKFAILVFGSVGVISGFISDVVAINIKADNKKGHAVIICIVCLIGEIASTSLFYILLTQQ